MVTRKSRAEIDRMRRAGRVVAEVLDLIEAELPPGVSTAHLDRLAEAHIARSGAIPSFKDYPGINPRRPFPARSASPSTTRSSTASPASRTITEGQIVSVDAGAIVDGWHGDAARTFFVGEPPAAVAELIDATRAAMMAGIAAAVPGNHIEDISAAVEDVALPKGYGIIRQFVGPRHRHRDARGAAGPQLPHRPAGPQAGGRAVPGHRADVHARPPRGARPAPTTGRSPPATDRSPPTSSTPSPSPMTGPQILTVA